MGAERSTRIQPKRTSTSHADPRDQRDQGGNAMILMPAGVLVMLILAAIAVDVALLNRSQAALENLAAAVANDVASSVSTRSLFDDDDSIGFDADLLDQLATRRAAASGIPGATCTLDVTAGPEPTGSATCTGRSNQVFGPAVGFTPSRLTATEDVVLDDG